MKAAVALMLSLALAMPIMVFAAFAYVMAGLTEYLSPQPGSGPRRRTPLFLSLGGGDNADRLD